MTTYHSNAVESRPPATNSRHRGLRLSKYARRLGKPVTMYEVREYFGWTAADTKRGMGYAVAVGLMREAGSMQFVATRVTP